MKKSRKASTQVRIVREGGKFEVWQGEIFVEAFDFGGDALALADQLRAGK